MISYAWCERLAGSPRAEVAGLLAACADADEEAGFSRPVLDDGAARHLLVRLEPDERPGVSGPRRLAGYLRIGADGEAAYVVHPDHRSRGVTTLLFEQVGDALPAFTIWARNAHPAAERLAGRFGVRAVRREWQLLAPLRETLPAVPALRATEDPHVLAAECGGTVRVDPDAAEWTEYGPAARIRTVRGEPARTLLAGAMAALRDAGQRYALLTVDATHHDLVSDARALGFRHDQTDVQYRMS